MLRRPVLLAAAPVLALALACALAVPAQAQFKLKPPKIKVPGTNTTVGGGGKVNTGKVAFNDDVVEITEARLDQLIKGLETERALAAKAEKENDANEKENERRTKAYDKEYAAYEKKDAAWEKCSDPIMRQGEAEMSEVNADASADMDQAKMEAVAKRIQAAQQQGNMAEVQRLADSVSKAAMRHSTRGQQVASGATDKVIKQCGPRPQEPTKPEQLPVMSDYDIRQAGDEAAGFEGSQGRILRERIVPFVESKGETSGGYVYTEKEVAALTAKLDALTPYLEHLQRY